MQQHENEDTDDCHNQAVVSRRRARKDSIGRNQTISRSGKATHSRRDSLNPRRVRNALAIFMVWLFGSHGVVAMAIAPLPRAKSVRPMLRQRCTAAGAKN